MSSSSNGAGEGAAHESRAAKSRMFLDLGDEFALQTLPARGAGRHVIGFVTARGNVSVEFLDGMCAPGLRVPFAQSTSLALGCESER